MTRTKTQERSALDVEQECLEMDRRAQLAGSEATAAAVAAERELREARKAREAAQDGIVRGEDGAEERLRAAVTRIHLASEQQVCAAMASEAAARVLRSARARLSQLREGCLDEFAVEADELVDQWGIAAEAAGVAMRAAVEAWNRAAAAWGPLAPAVRHRVEEMDRERGWDRDTNAVRAEASVPECPIDDVTLWKMRHVTPRPLAMSPGYEPGKALPVDVEPPGHEFLFDSDLIPQA